MDPIHLSPPAVNAGAAALLVEALDSGWLAPAGPYVEAFDTKLASKVGTQAAVGLSSGTAALHLGLLVVGVNPGDSVLVPTTTFVASANAAVYAGARPIFVDSESRSLNMDPQVVSDLLVRKASSNDLPSAAIVVDIYGQCANYADLLPLFERYEIPVVEDAAEALGSKHELGMAGSLGLVSAVSFNGNKIISLGGAGALASDDTALVERAAWLAGQAREPELHYEHRELGYNYRMNGLVAALGIAQLDQLDVEITRRTELRDNYQLAFAGEDGLAVMDTAPWNTPNNWLVVLDLDPAVYPAGGNSLCRALQAQCIDARPSWKPLHTQPLYAEAEAHVTGVGERAAEYSVCLPTAGRISDADQNRVIAAVNQWCASNRTTAIPDDNVIDITDRAIAAGEAAEVPAARAR